MCFCFSLSHPPPAIPQLPSPPSLYSHSPICPSPSLILLFIRPRRCCPALQTLSPSSPSLSRPVLSHTHPSAHFPPFPYRTEQEGYLTAESPEGNRSRVERFSCGSCGKFCFLPAASSLPTCGSFAPFFWRGFSKESSFIIPPFNNNSKIKMQRKYSSCFWSLVFSKHDSSKIAADKRIGKQGKGNWEGWWCVEWCACVRVCVGGVYLRPLVYRPCYRHTPPSMPIKQQQQQQQQQQQRHKKNPSSFINRGREGG